MLTNDQLKYLKTKQNKYFAFKQFCLGEMFAYKYLGLLDNHYFLVTSGLLAWKDCLIYMYFQKIYCENRNESCIY